MKDYQNFIGLDVSKKKFDLTLLDVKGDFVYHQSFSNTSKGIETAMDLLNSKAASPSEKWLFCMEHTGVYTTPLCCYLSERKLDYVLTSALQIKKSIGIRRAKSDKSDSRDIARYAYLYRQEVVCYNLPEKKLSQLKNLLGERERMIKALKMLKVADKETAAFEKEFVSHSEPVKKLMKETVKKLNDNILQLIRADKRMEEVYDLLTSVPGIGLQTATHLIVYTRCFTCFKDARKLACYAGVAPFPYSSGTSLKGRSKVSPLGNKRLKSLLNMAALNAVRSDIELKLYYEKKLKEGKNAMLVLNAVRNKLVHRAFATVKRGTPYVPLMKYAA